MPNPPQQNRRQYPRLRVSWSVVVNVGKNRYLSRSLDVSMYGAKVRTKARLATGTAVQLELVPSEGSPLRVEAVVWRVDSDGLAFLFRDRIQHPLLRAT
jgi:PilZ domain